MREIVIVGRPNSGKTMFALNFAGYLGVKHVDVTFRAYDDIITCRHFTLEAAKRELCDSIAHRTRCVQTLALKMPVGKTAVDFLLNDTCGVSEQIHSDITIRRGMAQTLKVMRYADYIFHVMDVLYLYNHQVTTGNIDYEIYQYGISRNAYTILANKVDLPLAKEYVPKIVTSFPQAKVIPISAMHGVGFREVKTCVARNI